MGYTKEKSMVFREKHHLFCTACKYGVFQRELQYLMSLDENVIQKCLFPLLLKLWALINVCFSCLGKKTS